MTNYDRLKWTPKLLHFKRKLMHSAVSTLLHLNGDYFLTAAIQDKRSLLPHRLNQTLIKLLKSALNKLLIWRKLLDYYSKRESFWPEHNDNTRRMWQIIIWGLYRY